MSDPLNNPSGAPGDPEAVGVPGGGAIPSDMAPGMAMAESEMPMTQGADSLGFVMDVPIELTVEIGRKKMKIGEVLRLGPGSVLELTKASGEPLDIYANNRLVARGEAVVIGERYGVRLTEVLVNDEVISDGSH